MFKHFNCIDIKIIILLGTFYLHRPDYFGKWFLE